MRKTKATNQGITGIPTLNGKPIKITDSWAKCTLRQYARILSLKDDTIELISILTGLEYDMLKKAKISGLETILVAGNFIRTKPEFPTTITKIGTYKLPLNSKKVFDIHFESLAQFEDMRQVMVNTKEGFAELMESYANYCAIYLQKLRDGEYDDDKAKQMISEVWEMPAFDVIPAGSFFLIRLLTLSNGTKKNSQNSNQTQDKRTGRRSKKHSGRTPR